MLLSCLLISSSAHAFIHGRSAKELMAWCQGEERRNICSDVMTDLLITEVYISRDKCIQGHELPNNIHALDYFDIFEAYLKRNPSISESDAMSYDLFLKALSEEFPCRTKTKKKR